ncbi:MAG TPA: SRPBCC family protein [Solirubrobacteraceae bacterium]|nr:SRPBCC family protein [Solirubrobacteraceae bacterium]
MPVARANRTVAAPVERVWDIVRDPYYLPRWWPRVERVEDVGAGAFTEVLRSNRGSVVRADFEVQEQDGARRRLVWAQRTVGTPFERLLDHSRTTIELAASDGGTDVALTLDQRPLGLFPGLGSLLMRRAARATLREALAELESLVA